MAAELPVRVLPVDGAQVADFPWPAASAAISTIDSTVSTLSTQLDQRSGLIGTLDDWEGRYRQEFDSALGDAISTATGLKDTLRSLASSIVGGAEDANHAQRIYNTEAIRRREAEQAQQVQQAQQAQSQSTPP